MGNPAIFVDRDDTIMVDVGYCKDPYLVSLLPGAAQGLRQLADAGFSIIIVTNQSGLGRGYFGREELDAVHERLREELKKEGADFHGLYYCPHLPDSGCQCRKPRPGLILRAASELGLDLGSSFAIGNGKPDLLAGRAAGTKTVQISNSGTPVRDKNQADFIARNLAEAARQILNKEYGQHTTKPVPLP